MGRALVGEIGEVAIVGREVATLGPSRVSAEAVGVATSTETESRENGPLPFEVLGMPTEEIGKSAVGRPST